MTLSPVIRHFDAAAAHYDQSAEAQRLIAAKLVAWAAEGLQAPASILDVGCGTGLLTEMLHRRWPEAALTALDAAPAMLVEAQRKVPRLATITGDALTAAPEQPFDAIFSSMVLHWLPDPRAALRRWQSWLRPEGKLFVALPVAGSFQEWRELCRRQGFDDGLWPLPAAAFADDLATRTELEPVEISYPSALDFLRSMKRAGAATPRDDHHPANAVKMRNALRNAPRPFAITYLTARLSLDALYTNP